VAGEVREEAVSLFVCVTGNIKYIVVTQLKFLQFSGGFRGRGSDRGGGGFRGRGGGFGGDRGGKYLVFGLYVTGQLGYFTKMSCFLDPAKNIH
jgi:hypothetical protein